MKRERIFTRLHTVKLRLLSILLVFVLLAAGVQLCIPVWAADDGDYERISNAQLGAPIPEEVWEYELQEGDLPLEKLKTAKLDESDLPSVMSLLFAQERGHVKRLEMQEPDDYTVMFQNRDGSKTMYIFSIPVKTQNANGFDSSNKVSLTPKSNKLKISASSGGIAAEFSRDLAERLGNVNSNHPLYDYNIGHCEVWQCGSEKLSSSSVCADITASAREWGKASDVCKEKFIFGDTELQNLTAVAHAADDVNGMICLSMTYSSIAGEYALKYNGNSRFLTNTGGHLQFKTSVFAQYGKWLFEYQRDGIYNIRSLADQDNYLVMLEDGSIGIGYTDAGQVMWYFDPDIGKLIPRHDTSLAIGASLNVTDVSSAGTWSLTNHDEFVEVSAITVTLPWTDIPLGAIFGREGDTLACRVSFTPSKPSYIGEIISQTSPIEEVNNCYDRTGDKYFIDVDIALLDVYYGNSMIVYPFKKSVKTTVPTLITPDVPINYIRDGFFNFAQGNGSEAKYIMVAHDGEAADFDASAAHSAVNELSNIIERPDDTRTQFYLSPYESTSGTFANQDDAFTIWALENDTYLTCAGKNEAPQLKSEFTDNAVWRILELSDGTIGIWSFATGQLLCVNDAGYLVSSNVSSGAHWNLRLGGIYCFENSATGRFITVEEGYDTDLKNRDNPQCVNIITEIENESGSLQDLDSNQYFRVVYKDSIGGYLMYPLCSMNGSRRVIGKSSIGTGQIVLKDYNINHMDSFEISVASDRLKFNIKYGEYAVTDSSGAVKFENFSASSEQTWNLRSSWSRARNEWKYKDIDIVFPLSGNNFTISSGYGYRYLIDYPPKKFHTGIDVPVNERVTTSLYSPFNGSVVVKGYASDLGNYILIKSNDAELYVCLYHLDAFADVSVNSDVRKGQLVGYAGNTGTSTGAHMHLTFTTKLNGKYADPASTFDPLIMYSKVGFVLKSDKQTDSIKGEELV